MDTTSIKEKVHELYWNDNVNCAQTMLICLGELFDVIYDTQVVNSAMGLHGASRFGAQCGLVEGGMMFISLYYSQLGKDKASIILSCHNYAEAFQQKFGASMCCDLRVNLISANDPRHLCEQLTCDAVAYANYFIRKENNM